MKDRNVFFLYFLVSNLEILDGASNRHDFGEQSSRLTILPFTQPLSSVPWPTVFSKIKPHPHVSLGIRDADLAAVTVEATEEKHGSSPVASWFKPLLACILCLSVASKRRQVKLKATQILSFNTTFLCNYVYNRNLGRHV